MDRTELLERLAPCGLHCGSCLAFEGSDIQRHAKDLQDALGQNFSMYAERFAAMHPVFAQYEAFRGSLEFLASGSCHGCRGAGCIFATCGVHACAGERGVDYCFQCAEFPCDRHGMPPALAERWRGNNERMREMGPEAWYLKIKDKPRYP